MGNIKILASGNSSQSISQAKGKLFEKLMANVLKHYGYKIDSHNTNINYSGIEIDIEGRGILNNVPLYAECKCYDSDIKSQELVKFFGKYMSRWLKDKKSQGLFIALPGINTHAKGFYQESIETNDEVSCIVLQEKEVLDSIWNINDVITPEIIEKKIQNDFGTPGDWTLIYTEKGYFWLNFIIPQGSGIPSKILISDGNGNPIDDEATIEYITTIYPDISSFEIITTEGKSRISSVQDSLTETIVEIRGSSECFEYQFPAAPEYFVGREKDICDFITFISKVVKRETTSRGILFEANSGWGKSSIILTCLEEAKKEGHFALAIDSRSASTSQFLLRVANYVSNKYKNYDSLTFDNVNKNISGFEGVNRYFIDVGKELEKNKKLLIVFFDQFENIFYQTDILQQIRDLFLKLSDSSKNVILGFSWKTDLVGLTNDFPYRMRDDISSSCKCIGLPTFSESETNAVLRMLENEANIKLRKDLAFFLSEFSQGYPWLLKKLCAHVKSQIDRGVPQSDIARTLLNVETLFQEDLQGLSPEEEETLRQISNAAPIAVSELGENFNPDVVQSLVARRLIVRIADKYDIYWDIFRDYLNYDRLPVQENYILRTQVATCVKATKVLNDANGILDLATFKDKVKLTDKSFYNVSRDMGLLGLAKIVDSNSIELQLTVNTTNFQSSLRNHLQERLSRNRLVWRFLTALKESNLNINQMSYLLQEWCPYISASDNTWQTYARIFAAWMDAADLIVWDQTNKTIRLYDPSIEIRERDLLLTSRRMLLAMHTLQIQYGAVEDVLLRLVSATQQRSKRVDWSDISKTTRFKTLATLEDFEFIRRDSRSKTLIVLPKLRDLSLKSHEYKSFLKDSVLNIESFQIFLTILQNHTQAVIPLKQLSEEFKNEIGANWTTNTAMTATKIMLNWARSTGLAPTVFDKQTKRFRRHRKPIETGQLRLF